MAKIILINKEEYEVTQEQAKLAYYAIKRNEYKCLVRSLVLPCANIKKIEFDCEQEQGQADCMCDGCVK